MAAIIAVIDTSALVAPGLRRRLQLAAQDGGFVGAWSPWIIAELHRVLVWRWIKDMTGRDLSDANERRCGQAAKAMMVLLHATFKLVDPAPPYPSAWATLRDLWDYPIWAAAKASGAAYVVSGNTHDYPPRQPDGRYIYEGIEYLSGRDFLTRVLELDEEN